ncbi:helix-turn-helix domain-containing protein [Paenibacillus filicis]|uniref:Helix-turn-helix domain-containing protein n=1 Tax=Paenibacillus gyeongsangnamensis TaxID=3388067 RepID=A0ABT4QD42_9BACL|nr:helix-turn-helix domain-containing protein [Paenibacillus filicis]MCZ8514701.1 helix-turn-helix domain-containing protein [Paenibacillus filicis]
MNGWFQSWLRYVKKYKYNSRFFRRSLTMMLLMASIPGLIIGVGIYWIASNNMEGELQRLHQNQIKQRAENIDEQLAYLELTFSHWAFDPKFDDRLKNLDITHQFEQVQELYRTLLVMEGAHPLLERVELFLDKPRPVIINKERFAYLDQNSVQAPYESLLKQPKSVFWTNEYPLSQTKPLPGRPAALSLVNKIPGGSTEPFGAIVATINQDYLMKMLKTLTPYNEGETILMTGDGGWRLSGSGDAPTGLDQSLVTEFGKHSAQSESFLFKYNKTTYSVSYGQFKRLGMTWTYISAAPLSTITAPVVLVSKWILYISLSALLLALIMSWFVSHRIYSPVERLVRLLSGEKGTELSDEFDLFEKQWTHLSKESESMRSKLNEQLPLLREGFFLQLVQGYLYSLSENDIRERMKHYGWNAEGRQFVALMFQLTGFSSLGGRFSPGDEDLVTFAADNIIQELTGTQYEQSEIVNFHNFSIGLLLSFPSDHPTGWLDDDLSPFCEEVTRTISRILKMQVTVSISKWGYQAKQIPLLFEEAKQALMYRDLSDENQIIKTDQLPKTNPMMESSYPFTLEKEIIHAIRSGLEDEAAELIGQFMKELSDSGSTELVVQQGMMQLLGSIRYTVLQSGMNPVHLFGSVNLFEQLSQIKEPEEMLKWFKMKVVGVYVAELISRQDFHLKQMVEQVILHLREQYMTVLSLDSCAEQFGTSPYTLSRAFKQITGINFIDYLTQIRIDNAKTLLRETDLKMGEVAERVGYQHTYFNRIFKKYEGITPSQFREMNRP